MTKLISGRIKKTPSANVSASRYDFLKLSEAEPDLGLPAANGYVLSGNVDGTRRWVLPSAVAAASETANVANTVLSISNFTTANLAEGSNLYYTNARVYANVIGLLNAKSNVADLTTANVVELTNLYYTNTRVYANVIGLLDVKANVADLTTSNVTEGSNLYYTNARVYANVIGLLNSKSNVVDLTTANVVESASNLYFTVTRSNVAIDNRVTKAFVENLGISSSSSAFAENANVSNTVLSIGNFTTANLIEGANLYYTNARVYANVIGLLDSKANIGDLTTSNIAEGTNLYYTNARVYANVIGLLNTKSNIADLTTANVTESASNLYYTVARANLAIDARVTKEFIDGLGISGSSAVFAENANVANIVLSIGNFTTSNLIEGANLYYTNARVYANVIGLLNEKANVVDLTTSNVTEGNNLYYTNARVYANVIGLLNTKANVVDLTTSNVTESTNSLYFTNARVLAGLITSNLVVNDATILGNLYVEGDIVTLNAATLSIEDKNIVLANGAINSTSADGAGFNIDGAQANLKYRNTGDKFEFNKSLDVLGTLTATAVYSNTWNNLFTSNVIESAGNLYYTVARANAAINDRVNKAFIDNLGISSSSAVFAENANVANIVLSIGNFTTSNLAEGTNLYYTNARVNAQVESNLALKSNVNDLTTANVTETTNLYYTNARVNSQVQANLALKANVADLNTSNVIEGDNLYYTNTRVYANVIPLLNLKANVVDLTSANVIELTNLYYTNARVYSNVIGLLNVKANVADLNTSNVIEGTNLYYTNARVYANVIGLLNEKANVVDLTTANVAELNNLYYTNTRVYANLTAASINALSDVDTATYPPALNQALMWDGTQWAPNTITISSAALVANIAIIAYNANIANVVLSIDNFTTSNLREGSNLYYTIERANAAIDARVTKEFVDGLGINATTLDGVDSTAFALSTSLTTSNITEGTNLYYTNARVYANVIGLISNKVGTADLTTANVKELDGNLYYTNARARTAISAGTGVIYDNSTGVISIGQNVDTLANVTFGQVNITGNLNVFGNVVGVYANSLIVNDSLIQFGYNNPSDSLDLGFIGHYNDSGTERRAGLFRDASDKKFKFFDNTTGDPSATTVDTLNPTFRLANVVATAFEGNVVGNVTGFVSSIGNFTTSDLAEGNNLYYTNARVYANVIGLLTNTVSTADLTTANVVELTNLYYTNSRVYSNVIGLLDAKANVSDLNTSNIVEGTNLYYTNARVYANISPLLFNYQTLANAALKANVADLNTSNIIEGTNLYYTNARVYANVIGLISNKVGVDDLTTANVKELSGNLYYTNERVYANIGPLLFNYLTLANATLKANVADLNTSNVIEGDNLYYTNARVYANVIGLISNKVGTADLTTANVKELDGNLYYTNARVYSNISPLLFNYQTLANAALKANVVDLTTANVSELTNLYYTNARVYANVIGLLNAKANVSDLDTSNVIEGTNLYYTNARVYANVIGLLDNYATAANLNLKANVVDLTTANVTELTNLYYTNARVLAGLVTSNLVVNDATIRGNLYVEGDVVTLNTATLSIEDKNIVLANGAVNSATADGAGFNIDGAQANLKYRSTGDKFEFNKSLDVIGTITAATVYSNTWNNLFTSNVIEGANLYYTVARANAAIDERVTKEFIDSLGISGSSAVFAERSNIANLVVSISNFTTSNLIEGANLYYTNARVYSNVISLLNAKANVADLTTANVAELTNLYYTNTRVYANIIPLLDLKANVADLNTSNVVEGTNLYYTNVRVYANVISLLNAKANVSDLDTSNVIEGTNLYYTNARVYANVISLLNAKANVVDLTTANVIESVNNLYYTNARVYANVIPLLDLKANVVDLNTSNVIEGTNLYYTNTRVYANVIPLLNLKANVVDLTTANVAESVNNLYYTNTRVYANVSERLSHLDTNIIPAVDELYDLGSPTHKFKDLYLSGFSITLGTTKLSSSAGGLLVNAITANIWNNLYTANVIETAGNLYFTNARVFNAITNQNVTFANVYANNLIAFDKVYANGLVIQGLDVTTSILAGNITSNSTSTTELFASNINVNEITSNIWNNLYTANVIETAGNLYYTNARVYANVISLLNAKANVVDLTTSNVVELNNLYYTNTRVYSNVISLLNAKANVTDLTTSNVVEGSSLYYTNARVHANVVALLPNVNVRITSSYQQFVSDGATTVYTLSTSVVDETSIFVIIDGLTQIPSLDYTASAVTLTLLTVPANQSNVVVRYFSASLSL